jgi:dsRNA-specific ribonuclease
MIDSKESKDAFIEIKKRFEHYYNTPYEIYTSELAPLKVLGDIFEACIGAVFLDTGFDYAYTRQICKRLMLPFIDHFTSPDMIRHYPQYKMIEYLK